MYAKFRFLNSTTSGERNKVLVQAITDCFDGVGPSNLGGYAGIDSDRSFFYSKDSSHWTFAGKGGAQSLGSDSINWDLSAATGSAYTLKCKYDTGHTAYCDVRLRGDVTNSGIYSGAGNATSTLVVRNRFGTSIEDMQYGNTAKTSPEDADIRGMGVAHSLNREIHVMADQTKIVLAGSDQYAADTRQLCMVYQFHQTTAMKYRDKVNNHASLVDDTSDSNVPVCAHFLTSGVGILNTNNIAYRDGDGYGSKWDDTVDKSPLILLPGNIYNERNGDKLRNYAFTSGNNYEMEKGGVVADDDVTKTPTAAPTLNPFSGYYAQNQSHRGFYHPTEWGGAAEADQERYDAINGEAYDIDSNGNKAIRLIPIYMDFHSLGGDEINMSDKSGIYRTVANAGFFGDSANIAGITYQYFPLSSVNAMMIRRD